MCLKSGCTSFKLRTLVVYSEDLCVFLFASLAFACWFYGGPSVEHFHTLIIPNGNSR